MLIPAVVCREVEEDSPSEMLKAPGDPDQEPSAAGGNGRTRGDPGREQGVRAWSTVWRPDLLERCRQAAGGNKRTGTDGRGSRGGRPPFTPGAAAGPGTERRRQGRGNIPGSPAWTAARIRNIPTICRRSVFPGKSWGKLLGDYLQEISAETISSQIRVSARDSADYATEVKVGDTLLSGEKSVCSSPCPPPVLRYRRRAEKSVFPAEERVTAWA